MKLKQVVAAAALVASSVCAFATPQYNGSTIADFSTTTQNNYAPFVNNGGGYYLWNEENNQSSWHLRWTASNTNLPGTSRIEWAGNIQFHNHLLDTWTGFSFENSQDQTGFSFIPGVQAQWYTSVTNEAVGIDGIDFTLDDGFELMEFTLGSTLFDGLTPERNDPGVPGTGIYIGQNFATPDVLVTVGQDMTYQSFEIKTVAEPGTLALLGLGLAGLGFARRKQAQAA